jgi:hypothetical protein
VVEGEDPSTVSFTPPNGGTGISVTARPGDATPSGGGSDIPNTRCGPVRVGGLSGTRCLDTISFAISTTLTGRGMSYTLSTSGKGGNLSVYQRMLDTFRMTGAAAASSGPTVRLARASGYSLAVAGSGWGAGARLTIEVRTGSVRRPVSPPPDPRNPPLTLHATSKGAFLVGIKGASLCGGLSVVVTDPSGRRAELAGPRVMCPPRGRPSRPTLVVLQGTP